MTGMNKVCEPVGVADRNRIPNARITASSFTLVVIILITANWMKVEDLEDGALRLHLIEQNIFKLIWVQCTLFVLWPHKEIGNRISGPPPTKFTCPQTAWIGTLTKKQILKRYWNTSLLNSYGKSTLFRCKTNISKTNNYSPTMISSSDILFHKRRRSVTPWHGVFVSREGKYLNEFILSIRASFLHAQSPPPPHASPWHLFD